MGRAFRSIWLAGVRRDSEGIHAFISGDPGETAGSWKEPWLKRMDKESTPRISLNPKEATTLGPSSNIASSWLAARPCPSQPRAVPAWEFWEGDSSWRAKGRSCGGPFSRGAPKNKWVVLLKKDAPNLSSQLMWLFVWPCWAPSKRRFEVLGPQQDPAQANREDLRYGR